MFIFGPTTARRTVADWISTYLRDGASIEANVDGSETPVEFAFTAAGACEIHRMIVTIQDAGSFQSNEYGNLTALTNGIDFEHSDGTTTTDLLDGVPITTNQGWAELCYDAEPKSYSGTQAVSQVVRWTFSRAGIPLYLADGDTLTARINDNLTGLTLHRFLLQGYYTRRRQT